MLTFRPDTPDERQSLPWTCSIRTTMWLLKSVGKNIDDGRRIEAEDLHEIMVPGLVTADLGLLVGSGASIKQLLRDRFGVPAENLSPVTWEWLQQHAGTRPIGIGGCVWNHWSAVRGRNADGTIALANPMPGYMGVWHTMNRDQFHALGQPFAAVWINLDAADEEEDVTRIAELEAEVARLTQELARERSFGSAILAHVIRPGFTLLDQALAAGQLDRAKIEAVRQLLGNNGGRD